MVKTETTIKKLREAKGYTQKDLAKALGISIKTLQNWEQGRSRTPEYVIRLLPILDIVD